MDNVPERTTTHSPSRSPASFGARMGIWIIIPCLMVGLVMEVRPFIILIRAAIAFAVCVAIGYVLASVISRYTNMKEALSSDSEGGHESSTDEGNASDEGTQSDEAINSEQTNN